MSATFGESIDNPGTIENLSNTFIPDSDHLSKEFIAC
jgi:hypothetical protein